MKKIVVNFILWILFSLMQCGPIVGTLEYGDSGPMETLWLMAPFSLLCLALVVITTCYAVPRLLLRRKWGLYASLEFCMAYIISLIEQIIIAYIWTEWEIIPPEHKLNWGWLAVNTLCNSLMLFFTLLAVGGWYLFDSARSDLKKEQTLSERIESYMAAVKRLLRPEALSARLEEIADKVEQYPQQAEKDINELASELRESLYNLPLAPTIAKETSVEDKENRKFNRWLTSRRYHAARVLILQLSLIGICFGAFFATPDGPEFGARLWGFLVLLAMFEIIAAVDVFIFFRSFRKKRRRGRFILASALLAAVMILPILAERVALYLSSPQGNDALFVFITTLAALGSVLMIVFYIAGIGAVLLYQDWMLHTRRLVCLQASTKRLEYANLKKQINPHFLFNVLNNAGILTKLDAGDARHILLELRHLIDYQFRETERSTASLTDTISFLRAYLGLEATRRDMFRFKVECEGNPEGIEVPALMYIPFVENAVKFAENKAGRKLVKVRFAISGSRLLFECENPVEDDAHTEFLPSASTETMPEAGGIGIANTLRRLELLFDDDFSYTAGRCGDIYRIALDIPVSGNSLSED
ncbi:MAG: histidine kinase [Muribaculaceae bacterium]|nr:histidine kinase [Muribaculaceae bacterium]